MANSDYLPGFSHHLHGRPSGAKRRNLTQQAAKLDGLAALVARFVPVELFEPAAQGRKRVFTPWVTFVAFLGQVLTRGSSCREAVRRVQGWFVAEICSISPRNVQCRLARREVPVEIVE